MEWFLFLGCNILLLFENKQNLNTQNEDKKEKEKNPNNVHCGKNGLYERTVDLGKMSLIQSQKIQIFDLYTSNYLCIYSFILLSFQK